MTQTAVKRNDSVDGSATHNNTITTDGSDTVTLNLWWKKSYITALPDLHTISVQIQPAAGDWSAPTTIWTHTDFGNFDWTQVSNLDVSSYFGTSTYDYRYYMDISNSNNDSQSTAWIDNTSLDVTSLVVSVSVSTTTIAYGMLDLGATSSTIVNGDTLVVTNDGNVTEDFNIRGYDTAAWTLAGSIGNNQYKHEFSTTTGSSWSALATSSQTMIQGLVQNATTSLDLMITVPSDNSTTTEQSANIMIQAVQSQ